MNTSHMRLRKTRDLQVHCRQLVLLGAFEVAILFRGQYINQLLVNYINGLRFGLSQAIWLHSWELMSTISKAKRIVPLLGATHHHHA